MIKSTNNKYVYETVRDKLGLCVFGTESAALRYRDDAVATLKIQARNFGKNLLNQLIKDRKSLQVTRVCYDEVEQILNWNYKSNGWINFITNEETEDEGRFQNYMMLYNEKAALLYAERRSKTLNLSQ